jgi:hypothetical protein
MLSASLAAAGARGVKCPDLTRGGKIPDRWTHDWNLGPTGARGWMYSDTGVTTEARQIQVTKVDKGSPVDGVLQVGDVIVGVRGKAFDGDPRILFGKAITEVEKTVNRGRMRLLVWRKGKTRNVIVKLKPLGTYSLTAPYKCLKSKRIIDQGCEAIARSMKAKPTGGHIIARALNATALLAGGNRAHLPIVRAQVKLLSEYNQSRGVRTWQYAYVNILLAEYVLATGDRTYVDRGLKRITKMIVDGQSTVGSWGHGFVDKETRRLGGYGMMNAPGIPLTYSLVLARKAGLRSSALDDAIHKSETFLKFYVGKGGVPYGDHQPWIQTHCDNGKNEMAAVLFDFQRNPKATEFFSRMAVASYGAERDTGHTGNFFNMTWALPGVARSGPNATGAWMKEFGWYYDLARRWDGTYGYQGHPAERPQVYRNWDCTGAYVIGYAQALQKIYLTGKKPSAAPQITRATADNLIEDGRGWTNKDRRSYYDKLSTKQLLKRLSSWSPTVRERSAMALGRRKDQVVPALIRLLGARDLYSQYGACQAIRLQRARAEPAIAALRKTIDADDLWLRVLAAEALGGIGKPARVASVDLLTKFTRRDLKSDPRNMEQRYLTFVLFGGRGLLGRSLDGIDRDLLFKAVRAGLLNEDGRARGNIRSVYKNLTYEEIKPLLGAINQAIIEPAPSGIMFADGIRLSGLEFFVKYRIREGMEGIVRYARDQKLHGSKPRLIRVMKFLTSYGAHAKSMIPKLKELVTYFPTQTAHPRSINREKSKIVEETIQKIQAATERPKLIHLKPLKK